MRPGCRLRRQDSGLNSSRRVLQLPGPCFCHPDGFFGSPAVFLLPARPYFFRKRNPGFSSRRLSTWNAILASQRPSFFPGHYSGHQSRVFVSESPSFFVKAHPGLRVRRLRSYGWRRWSRKADILFLVADTFENEARRLAGLIGSLVELSGRPVEAVAAAAGLSPEDLAGIFRGDARLEVAHILRLAEALGMHPAEFFYLSHPRVPARASTRELLERGRAALRAGSGGAAATPGGPENRGPSGAGPGSPSAGGRPRGGRQRP